MRLLATTVQSDGLHILNPTLISSEQCLLALDIVTEGGSPIQLSGKVVWYDRTEEENPFSFQMGIMFLEVTPEATQRILDLFTHLPATNGK